MCGIVGFVGAGDEADLTLMRDSMTYRGPNDFGTQIGSNWGLAHRRLSIIDTSEKGRQPISNERNTIFAVVNGEIYNFRALRQELETKGHRFISHSDSEVIVHGYEEWGTTLLDRLDGMFAFGIYDTLNGMLFLARDRFGKKPLYYCKNTAGLYFGSEIRALLTSQYVNTEIEQESIMKYLLFGYVPAPGTLYNGVFQLLPGESLIYDSKRQIQKRIYYDIHIQSADYKESFPNSILKFHDHLKKAVSKRMISDVPLGVLLSGGLDSAAVTWLAKQANPNQLQSFSIGFENKSYDETSWAEEASRVIGTQHHSFIFTLADAKKLLFEVLDHMSEPFGNSTMIPVYALSKFTRQHVTVALSGEGGDEVLMGYPIFSAHKLSGLFQLLPRFLRVSLIEAALNALPAGLNKDNKITLMRRFLFGSKGNLKYQDQKFCNFFSDEILDQATSLQLKEENLYEDLDYFLKQDHVKNLTSLEKSQFLSFKFILAGDMLFKVDRASMAHSLEIRCPFLDTELVDFANTLPMDFKLKGIFSTKRILKAMLEEKFGKRFVYRRKGALIPPISIWLKEDFLNLARERLTRKGIRDLGLKPEVILGLLSDHLKGKFDYGRPLWCLVALISTIENNNSIIKNRSLKTS